MKALKILLTIGIFFALAASAQGVYAQTFTLQPVDPAKSISVGDSFQVNILINTNGEKVNNGDALVNFDPLKVSINSAQFATFFPYISYSHADLLGGQTSKYLVTIGQDNVAQAPSSTVNTLFATLNLTARGGGTTSLSFDCTPGTGADTNINRASDAQDIINCSALTPLNLTIGGSVITPSPTVIASPTSTPRPTATVAPTSTPVPTNTPRPTISQLPRSGTTEITVGIFGVGILLTVVGLLVIL